MATENQVAKLAATLIGNDARIVALSDDRPTARALVDVWDLQRRAAIRDGSWNFAARRAALQAEANVPAAELHPYAYRYPMPAASLRLIEVLNRGYRDAYQIEGDKILCDAAAPLYIRYAIDVPEPGKWDDDFANAFAHRLAWACGQKIAGSAFDRDGIWSAYQGLLGRAKTVDAIENPPIESEESSWITARGASCRGLNTGTWSVE